MVSIVIKKRRLACAGFLALLLIMCLCFFHWLSASYIHPRSDEKEVAADSISAQPVELDVISSKQGSVKYEKSLLDVDKKEFFVECRLTRDRVRSQQIEVLKEIAGNPSSSVEARDRAQNNLISIIENIGKENELEKLIIARGFKDAVVILQNNSATVVVQARSISPKEVEKMADLIKMTTGFERSNIFIIPKP